jgi:hypothetical protein
MTKIPLSLSTRKQIAADYMNKAFTLYPKWNEVNTNAVKTNEPLTLPQPTYPQKLLNVNISDKKMAQVPLDEITKSVLCGTILGDTSFTINKKYRNARFQAKHSTKQFTWFVWKYGVILKDFVSPSGLVFTQRDGFQLNSVQDNSASNNAGEMEEKELKLLGDFQTFGKLKIASRADVRLTELHGVICVNNHKTIQRYWLNHMNNYFLMTIWLDNGSLSCENSRQGIISFNSIPIEEQQIFREYLLKVWEIETRFDDTKKFLANGQKNMRIAIKNQENLQRLLRIIAPVVPVREMLYKLCFVPKDMSLLQRWRTELKGLVRPEFSLEIDKIYDEKQFKI